jgi:hypothetical protein
MASGRELMETPTVKLAAIALVKYIDFAGERLAWQSRLDALRQSYERYGATEENALEDRRLRTDIARLAITKLAEQNDAAAVVEVFKDYNSTGYDFLGSVLEVIRLTYISDGQSS